MAGEGKGADKDVSSVAQTAVAGMSKLALGSIPSTTKLVLKEG